ncbi:MAG: 5'/3'-nucleotidase SurE, partial [Aquificota bacterium]
MSKYKVLLVNDDGYLSKGINAIRDKLIDNGFDVITVAP